jgi:hypothetical protein
MGQDLVHSLTELISWYLSTHAGGKRLLRSVWGDERLTGLSALLVPAVSPERTQICLGRPKRALTRYDSGCDLSLGTLTPAG